jgi:hypothetical protein
MSIFIKDLLYIKLKILEIIVVHNISIILLIALTLRT